MDAVRAELEQQEVTLISGPADRDWGMRTMTFADPGGYTASELLAVISARLPWEWIFVIA